MEKITTTVYKTFDGTIFTDQNEAIEYEYKNANVVAFKVYYMPDLNEGRGFDKFGYILVNANSFHNEFAREFCFKKFGNEITFVMGVYGSNAITKNWLLSRCDMEEVDDGQVIAKLEDKFAKVKIFYTKE